MLWKGERFALKLPLFSLGLVVSCFLVLGESSMNSVSQVNLTKSG